MALTLRVSRRPAAAQSRAGDDAPEPDPGQTTEPRQVGSGLRRPRVPPHRQRAPPKPGPEAEGEGGGDRDP